MPLSVDAHRQGFFALNVCARIHGTRSSAFSTRAIEETVYLSRDAQAGQLAIYLHHASESATMLGVLTTRGSMLITAKTIGSKKPLFADFSIPLPPGWNDDDGDAGRTLRDLIGHVVRQEVDAFRKRQLDRQLLRALTATEINEAVEKGKIQMGDSEVGTQDVDELEAVSAAWVAFEDGLYLVIIDERQFKSLDEAVFLTDKSQLTFIRLTMLSGA